LLKSEISNLKSKIDLLVFDLGRVLVQIADDLDDAATRAGRSGLPGFTGDLSAHTRRGGNEEVARLLSGYERGNVATADYAGGIAAQVDADPDDVAAIHDAVLIRAFDGLSAFYDRLGDAPVLTACFSNTNAVHWARIADPDDPAFLDPDRLDFRFASHQIRRAKPDAEAYAYVEAATRVRPDRILFFDDLAENVAAATERGWQTEHVPRMDNPLPWVAERLAAYGVFP